MKHVYEGKTKSVYELENGNYLLKMKDDVTGENGQIDPGANSLMGQLDGMGNASLRMSKYYFELLQKNNIPSHFIDANLEENTMIVKPAKTFGDGLEIICRYKVYGSFLRRYAKYAKKEQLLNELVEVTLKDDERGDPPITEESLVQLGLVTHDEYKLIRSTTQQIARVIKDDLAAKGLDLYDIKFEFGRVGDEIMVIDDISGGNMRVFKDGIQVDPLVLATLVTVQ
ncbi:MAG: phosphoribosylaminoimidazolesuccinocarboxamide synthase [Syntrophomonas sp.]|nr:phosphoribosylaminoimidazolesuccinocarboxamide synthase [Syntrophomonas sp.]